MLQHEEEQDEKREFASKNRSKSAFEDDVLDKLFIVAEDIQNVLECEFTYQSVNKHKFLYIQRLIDLKIANMNGMVHQKKLRNAMLEYWGEEVLQILQCSIDKDKDCLWLNSLVRENDIPSQPIRHILLCRFLGIDIGSLLSEENLSKSHLELWEDALLSLVDSGLSIREMAKKVDSTPKTVRKYLDKHKVTQFWINNGGGKYKDKPFVETQDFIDKRDKAREEWLHLINENPDLSRNKLRKVNETLYSRLMRYNKKWVDSHSPNIRLIGNLTGRQRMPSFFPR